MEADPHVHGVVLLPHQHQDQSVESKPTEQTICSVHFIRYIPKLVPEESE